MTDIARALKEMADTIPDDAGSEQMVGELTRMAVVVRRRRAVRHTRRLAVAGGVAGALVVGGVPLVQWVAPGPGPGPMPIGQVGEDAVGLAVDPSFLDSARAGQASAEQVSVLEDGRVSFDEYQSAVDRTLSCMRDAGIDVGDSGVSRSRGFRVITYAFPTSSPGRTDDQTLAIADDCIATHSWFVEAAYETSPEALEVVEVEFGPYRDSIIACVLANDGDIADDAGRSEALLAASDVKRDTGVDCVEDAGYR